MRLAPAFVPGLAAALAVVAVMADRALVGQAAAARAAALAGLDEESRQTALTVRATLAQLEQALAAGRPPPGVATERLFAPPPRSVPPRGFTPYAGRPRSEPAELFSSTAATPSGLPEAAVARIALGPAVPVSGGAGPPAVEERLLAGELPVRPEDLPFLARRLGIASDPRVAALGARLRLAPDASEVPAAPGFRRRLAGDGRIEGWTRSADGRLLRYELPVAALLERAGVSERASLPGGEGQEPGSPSRAVAVPDVEGLSIRVAARLPGAFRLAAGEVRERLLAPNGFVARLEGNLLEIGRPELFGERRAFTGAPISFDYADKDLADGLREIAAHGRATVEVPEGVTGRIWLKLDKVPWDQAFDVLARVNGLTWTRTGEVIRVQVWRRLKS